MRRYVLSFLVGGLLLGTVTAKVDAGSFLYQPSYEMDEVRRGPAEPYVPQPGDVVLSTSCNLVAEAGHRLAFSGPPHHSGIVFARPDGSMAILEAGPFNTIHVEGVDLTWCLEHHGERAEITWIRRHKTPLTAEQSAKLTEWAVAQEGKRFAVFRLLTQITLFRARGPLRTYVMGESHGERSSYFCSELVMESCVHVGLVAAENTRPSATYPRDLFFDHSVNPFLNEHMPLSEGWYPPARWTNRLDAEGTKETVKK